MTFSHRVTNGFSLNFRSPLFKLSPKEKRREPYTPAPSSRRRSDQNKMAMYVVKRDGRQEPVHFDKITARISKLSYGLNQEFCDPVRRSLKS